jgi:general secretion pathway protein F
MRTYEYRGFDRTGRTCKGLVEAAGLKDAREKLAGDGILAERMEPTGRQIRFPAQTRAMVYRELSALLKAGLPIVKALGILIEAPELTGSHALLAGVRDRVRDGATLAGAVCEASRSVQPHERAVIEAAEESGEMPGMLEHLAGFLEEQDKLKERVQSALIYPAIVVAVGICVGIVMLGLLVPRTADLVAGSRVPLPALSRFMMRLGAGVMKAGPVVLLLLAVGGGYVRMRMGRDAGFRSRLNRWLFGIPLLGRGYRLLVCLRFSKTLSVLLRGGVSVIDGLVLAGRATGSAWIEELAGAEAESVRHGSSLSDAVRRIPPLAASLPAWIQVGEAGGGLESLLERAGHRYEYAWDRFVGRSLSLLEPLLILIVGGFVLLVTLSVLLPVISVTQSVGQ